MSRIYLIATAAFLILSGLALGDAEARPRTRNCSKAAQKNIAEAVRFINDHMGQLKNPPFSLGKRRLQRRRIQRRMDRKLGKMRYGCAARVMCPVGKSKNAHMMFGIMGRKVRLCYDNMLKYKRFSFCDFAGTVAHEFGHAVGIPKDPFARHGKNRSDRVYQFGRYAAKLCREAGLNRPLE
jgi:hypothetical protein